MTKKLSGITILAILAFAVMAQADMVELNLFTLGCPTTFNINSQYWETNFNLGVTFSQISNIYMDWSGEITGGQFYNPWDNPPIFPIDIGIRADLGQYPNWRYAEIWAGESTYPEPETFDQLSGFVRNSPLPDLFNGQGVIGLEYDVLGYAEGSYIEYGVVNLTRAKLVIEGTIIPEPLTITFLITGIILLRKNKKS